MQKSRPQTVKNCEQKLKRGSYGTDKVHGLTLYILNIYIYIYIYIYIIYFK